MCHVSTLDVPGSKFCALLTNFNGFGIAVYEVTNSVGLIVLKITERRFFVSLANVHLICKVSWHARTVLVPLGPDSLRSSKRQLQQNVHLFGLSVSLMYQPQEKQRSPINTQHKESGYKQVSPPRHRKQPHQPESKVMS